MTFQLLQNYYFLYFFLCNPSECSFGKGKSYCWAIKFYKPLKNVVKYGNDGTTRLVKAEIFIIKVARSDIKLV